MKNTHDSHRPRIKVKKPYGKNTHYIILFIWSSNQAQRSWCRSFWWERLGIVGGASWSRSEVLFLDPGLGTQLKAGLHDSDGCLYVSNFSLKYRVSHMVISIVEKPPKGTGARKWWALGGCCSFKPDGEGWPHWADVAVKTWGEGKGFGHLWAEGGPGAMALQCDRWGVWLQQWVTGRAMGSEVRDVTLTLSGWETLGIWGKEWHE